MCSTRLAANTGGKKVAKNRHLGTVPQLCRAISSQIRHISTIGKNMLSSNTSSICARNMVNFGPLAAENVSLVWGTPANFNGFLVLASLYCTALTSGRQPDFAALNRGRHLYSAGRPSRWVLTHILVDNYLNFKCPYISAITHNAYVRASCWYSNESFYNVCSIYFGIQYTCVVSSYCL